MNIKRYNLAADSNNGLYLKAAPKGALFLPLEDFRLALKSLRGDEVLYTQCELNDLKILSREYGLNPSRGKL